MISLPPRPPTPPIGRMRVVEADGTATLEFAQWLAKLTHWLGHIPPPPAEPQPRSTQTLADWLRENVP
jgi:hypothetical protein